MANTKPHVDWEGLLKPPALPSADDKLFTTAEDWWNNACLNWLPAGWDWDLYATGYKDAADILVSHIQDNNRHHDTMIYPIVFLYRQYLELAIKNLIRQVRRLQDVTEPFPKIHRIDELWCICHRLLSQIAPGDSEEELKHITRLIEEFSTVDPTSMAFRYPEDKGGSPSLPGITHINLRIVKEVIGKISVIIEGASAMVGEYLSFKWEMEREMEREYDSGGY